MSKNDWNFPLNNDGAEVGLNEGNIATFRGRRYISLAREIIQNSLDAALEDSGKPVEVHFQCFNDDRNIFPAVDHFVSVLNQCRDFAETKKDKDFFKKAISAAKAETINFLKISDYNTTGVTGSDKLRNSEWHRITKAVGVSDKRSGAGGSYGIGKHAPYACSDLLTVFYTTVDKDGKTAFQGVAKLITHDDDSDKTRQGTGFYGVVNQNRPITDFSQIHPFFIRSKVGTDVVVAGFHADPGWEKMIIISVIESFFVAIMTEKLIVKVESVVIDRDSLESLIEEYILPETGSLADKYYQTLISEDHIYKSFEIDDLGSLELCLLPKADYPKKVAMVRQSGMKIFDKIFRSPMRFAGVLIVNGEKLNDELRMIESPTHDAWEPERNVDRISHSRNLIKKIYQWVKEQLNLLVQVDESENVDVDGLGQFLPDEFEDAPFEDPQGEGEHTRPKSVDVTVYPIKAPKPTVAQAGDEAAAATDDGDEPGEAPSAGNKPNDAEGGSPPMKPDNVNGEAAGGEAQAGGQGPNSHKSDPKRLKYLRAFCEDPLQGQYRINYIAEFNGTGYLSATIVGDDHTDKDKAPVISAVDVNSGLPVVCKDGIIGPVNFVADAKSGLRITLADGLRCALEVSARAD